MEGEGEMVDNPPYRSQQTRLQHSASRRQQRAGIQMTPGCRHGLCGDVGLLFALESRGILDKKETLKATATQQ